MENKKPVTAKQIQANKIKELVHLVSRISSNPALIFQLLFVLHL